MLAVTSGRSSLRCSKHGHDVGQHALVDVGAALEALGTLAGRGGQAFVGNDTLGITVEQVERVGLALDRCQLVVQVVALGLQLLADRGGAYA